MESQYYYFFGLSIWEVSIFIFTWRTSMAPGRKDSRFLKDTGDFMALAKFIQGTS